MENTAAPTVRFGDWISEGWKMFAEQWKAWVIHMLVFFALVFVPLTLFMFVIFAMMPAVANSQNAIFPLVVFPLFFILMLFVVVAQTFLIGGMYRSAFKQLRGGRIELGDLFSAREQFLPLLGATLILVLLMMLGALLCVIPMFIVMGMFFFTIPLIVERRLGVFDAMQASREVTGRDLLTFTLFAFVTYLIAQAGTYACYVGILATYPLQFTISAVAYRDCFGLPGARSFLPDAAAPPQSADNYIPVPTYVPPQPPEQPQPPQPFQPPQPPQSSQPSQPLQPPPPQPDTTPTSTQVWASPLPGPQQAEPDTFLCSNCQMVLPRGAAFCPRCGTNVRA